jgi:hypothetical protein
MRRKEKEKKKTGKDLIKTLIRAESCSIHPTPILIPPDPREKSANLLLELDVRSTRSGSRRSMPSTIAGRHLVPLNGDAVPATF